MSEALNQHYHQLLGWTRLGKRPDWADPPGFAGEEFWRIPSGGEIRDRLPNLHEDANLAIAELDRVFDRWQIHKQVGARYWVVGWIANDTAIRNYADEGASFHEAALKCLIAAHKRESEAV